LLQDKYFINNMLQLKLKVIHKARWI